MGPGRREDRTLADYVSTSLITGVVGGWMLWSSGTGGGGQLMAEVLLVACPVLLAVGVILHVSRRL